MAGEKRSGKLSAWIMKKKSGTSMVRVRSYNKRYFTIDFDSRVFFYAHNDTTRKVNAVVPFADIVAVSRPEVNLDMAETQSTTSKQSRVSFLRRMGSGKLGMGKGDDEKENKDQFTLVIQIKPSRDMELSCSSVGEALEWFEAFKAAKEIGGGASPGAALRSGSPVENSEGSDGAEQPQPAGVEGERSQTASARRPPAMPPRPAPAASGVADAAREAEREPREADPARAQGPASAREEASPAGRQEATEVEPPKPPVHGTLWDLATGAEGAEGGRGGDAQAARGPAEDCEAVQEVTNLTSPGSDGPTNLQATDFGFDGFEPSDSESEAEEIPAMGSTADAGASPAPAQQADAGSPVAQGVFAEAAAAPAKSYADRHEGLTMQQRLANLEFSDDEDEDDDDPLGLKAQGR